MRRGPAAIALLLACSLAVASAADRAWAGPLCVAPGDQGAPVVASDGAGGAYVAWIDPRLGYNTDVYLQRVRASGAVAPGWPADGVGVTYITCSKRDLSLAPDGVLSVADGAAGVFAAWAEVRCPNSTGNDIYVQRMTAAHVPSAGWPVNGLALCRAGGEQTRPAVAADGAGGAFVAWLDQRAGRPQIRAARVLANGVPHANWLLDGVLVADSAAAGARPAITADGEGGVWIAWEDARAGSSDVALQRLDANGAPAPGWPARGLAVCAAAGAQSAPVLVADGATPPGAATGVIAAWIDARSGAGFVYATRVLPSGAVAGGWTANGAAVAAGPFAQGAATLLADAGGAFVAWQENRGAPAVVVQRLGSDGAPVAGWPAGGRTAGATAADPAAPSLATDAQGGVFVAWTDARSAGATGLDIGVQRVLADGAIAAGWPAAGFALSAAPGAQRDARLVPDGAGGAHVAWSDARNAAVTGLDVAADKLTPQGPQPTRASALAALHHDGQTFLTWTCPPGSGWTYRVYRSNSPITSAADLDAATLLGSAGDSSAYDRRLATRTGIVRGFSVDSLAPSLDPAQGLFVATCTANGGGWYAVTSQPGAFPEDRVVTPGDNALAASVGEVVAPVRPVFQSLVAFNDVTSSVYTMWASDRETPDTPAMANRGSIAYDFAMHGGGASPPGPLLLRLHHSRGNFMDVVRGTSEPGEWLLTMDDTLPSGWNTYWFGYHPDYDITREVNGVPAGGVVVDYTSRRILYTLDWMLRSFPIDPNRVVVFGYSMGGMGALQLLFQHPDRFAAGMGVVGKVDFSFLTDPDTTSWANPGRSMRYVTDQLWGTVADNLPTPGGLPVFDLLNDTYLAGTPSTRNLPPVFTVSGKLDNISGWAEKIPFFQAMRDHRRGGTFFWDMRGHLTSGDQLWIPMENPAYLHRFRLNRSYPALTNCNLDDDPGDGHATSGDSVGAINAFVEWNPEVVDEHDRWETEIHTRGIIRLDQVLYAPDSALVDVTPRRVQRFTVAPYQPVHYRIVSVIDTTTVRSGIVQADALGEVTVTGVPVFSWGTRLALDTVLTLDAPGAIAPRRLALAVERNPSRGPTVAHVTWPAAGRGRVDLLDVAGRRVRRLFDGDVTAGVARVSVDARALRAGLYFVAAESGGARVTRRWVLLP